MLPGENIIYKYCNSKYQLFFCSYHTIETATSLVSTVFEEAVKSPLVKDVGVRIKLVFHFMVV